MGEVTKYVLSLFLLFPLERSCWSKWLADGCLTLDRYHVYNIRNLGGDYVDNYFKAAELLAGVEDMTFQGSSLVGYHQHRQYGVDERSVCLLSPSLLLFVYPLSFVPLPQASSFLLHPHSPSLHPSMLRLFLRPSVRARANIPSRHQGNKTPLSATASPSQAPRSPRSPHPHGLPRRDRREDRGWVLQGF